MGPAKQPHSNSSNKSSYYPLPLKIRHCSENRYARILIKIQHNRNHSWGRSAAIPSRLHGASPWPSARRSSIPALAEPYRRTPLMANASPQPSPARRRRTTHRHPHPAGMRRMGPPPPPSSCAAARRGSPFPARFLVLPHNK